MADQEKFARLAAEWESTPEAVEAAWRAGWDIDQGPPPDDNLGRHALPPAEDPALGHNGVAPTDSPRLWVNDLHPGHSDTDLERAKEQAQRDLEETGK